MAPVSFEPARCSLVCLPTLPVSNFLYLSLLSSPGSVPSPSQQVSFSRGHSQSQSQEGREEDNMDHTENTQSHSSNTRGTFTGRMLKVEDALQYIGLVKVRFLHEPHVYDFFLEIMKDFKAQTLTTPEVVARVNSLFMAHSDLIHGFKKFLPPDYYIETYEESTTGNTTAIQHATNSMGFSPISDRGDYMPEQSGDQNSRDGQGATHLVRHLQSDRSYSNHVEAADHMQGGPTGAFDVEDSDAHLVACNLVDMVTAQREATLELDLSMAGLALVQDRSPDSVDGSPDPSALETAEMIEFEKAVRFINKIKNRFADHSSIYDSFLDILRGYEWDRKIINDIHRLVSELFKDHNDLLTEFNYFVSEKVRCIAPVCPGTN